MTKNTAKATHPADGGSAQRGASRPETAAAPTRANTMRPRVGYSRTPRHQARPGGRPPRPHQAGEQHAVGGQLGHRAEAHGRGAEEDGGDDSGRHDLDRPRRTAAVGAAPGGPAAASAPARAQDQAAGARAGSGWAVGVRIGLGRRGTGRILRDGAGAAGSESRAGGIRAATTSRAAPASPPASAQPATRAAFMPDSVPAGTTPGRDGPRGWTNRPLDAGPGGPRLSSRGCPRRRGR